MVNSLNMYQGNEISIANEKIKVCFNWDAFPRQRSMGLIGGLLYESVSVDCDASAVFFDRNEKPISTQKNEACLRYDNDSMFDGAARHGGDNQSGEGADDEIIYLDLKAIPSEVESIVFTLDLFKEKKRSRIGKIQNTFIRIIRESDSEQLGQFDFYLSGGHQLMTVCGILRRNHDKWLFSPPMHEMVGVKSMNEFIEMLNWNEYLKRFAVKKKE